MFCPAGPGPGPACARSRMFDYVYTDHAQYTIKTYAKMALFRLVLTGPLSILGHDLYGMTAICDFSIVLCSVLFFTGLPFDHR